MPDDVAYHGAILARHYATTGAKRVSADIPSADTKRPSQASPVLSCLTPRQQQVMALVLDGRPSKIIAGDLKISQRTVENHRAAIMRRTGATSLPSLVRLSLGMQ